ncbi:MAG: alanine--tRNA ligase [Bacteroidetes bacterium]|nr:alanine--tRNA ligase [Bacteroidota bacterium]MBS1973002.1 alanine--tRNA ligase [Bacteroidota bacterium]
MTSADIRNKFLEFFQSKGHVVVPSAPIVIKNDPSLLFTNAGMNQFKDYFLGNKKPPSPRVADTQKCLRVSGKHNDLEEVGVDTYHHTMFEMLGNWSFGDYFKKEAIAWSWELLTKVYKLDQNRLYVTVFEGDEKEGLPKDDEAFGEWKKWISEDRILPGNKRDNFWEMGDTGPCGPCTEIHYDTRPEAKNDGHAFVNNDDTGMVMEIWNNVFIQFNRSKDGSLEPLPAKHVDTGMGLERLVRVLQGKLSNYDTDLFTGTIAEVERITGQKYTNTDSKQDIAFRVIADHVRAISFCIADGQLPSNTGAGYVIRRILRRAVRYYYSYLDYKHPLLFQLVPLLAKQFENVFPELEKQKDFVGKVIKEEEESFLRTLANGLLRVEMFVSLEGLPLFLKGEKNAFILPGNIAFELYDTYGFPLDLTKLIAGEKGLIVDEEGFNAEMKKQKARSRAATAIDAGDWIILDNEPAKFVGYNNLETSTAVKQYRKVNAKGKELYHVVLDETPFYAESGGQVGDTGILDFGGEQINVIDTKKENDLIIHYLDKFSGDSTNYVIAKVDEPRRARIKAHHSATHLLHAALRKVLGTHVAQKGSLVNDEHLRFDFSHFAKLTDEELAKAEALVNEKIRENIPVVIKQMPKQEALELGAMALFGEKYGDVVRVVIIDPDYSIELCGGTHVGATGELGFFKITHEAAVAAGVRRIEAISGKAAEDFVNEGFAQIRAVRESLKNPKDLGKSIDSLLSENEELKKHIERLEARQLIVIRNELLQKDEIINQINFIGHIVEVSSADALKKLCFDLKNHLRDFVVVLCANIGGKPFAAVCIADNVAAAKNLDANKIIKEHVAPIIKGGGGGQKTLATAGGQDAGNLHAIIEQVKALL